MSTSDRADRVGDFVVPCPSDVVLIFQVSGIFSLTDRKIKFSREREFKPLVVFHLYHHHLRGEGLKYLEWWKRCDFLQTLSNLLLYLSTHCRFLSKHYCIRSFHCSKQTYDCLFVFESPLKVHGHRSFESFSTMSTKMSFCSWVTFFGTIFAHAIFMQNLSYCLYMSVEIRL